MPKVGGFILEGCTARPRHPVFGPSGLCLALALATQLAACGPQKAKQAATAVNSPAPVVEIAAAQPAAPAKASVPAEVPNSPEYTACMNREDAASGVTAAMLDCLGEEYDRQDARLNKAYKALLSRSDAAAQTRIRTAERAWVKNKDKTCNPPPSECSGGTAASLDRSSCLVDATIRQAMVLEAQLSGTTKN